MVKDIIVTCQEGGVSSEPPQKGRSFPETLAHEQWNFTETSYYGSYTTGQVNTI